MKSGSVVRLLAGIGVLSVLVACSSSSEGSGPAASATAVGSATSDLDQAAPVSDVLKADDPPPDGLPEQLDYFSGGGSECPDPENSRLTVEVDPWARVPDTPLVQPGSLPICISGIDPELDLTIDILDPAGDPFDHRDVKGGSGGDSPGLETRFRSSPGDPVGTYSVKVAQGGRTASDTAEVVRAIEPRIVWGDTDEDSGVSDANLGDTLSLEFGGVPANSQTVIHIYAGEVRQGAVEPIPMPYRTTRSVLSNSYGGGEATFTTLADDPSICYAFALEGMDNPQYPPSICLYRADPTSSS